MDTVWSVSAMPDFPLPPTCSAGSIAYERQCNNLATGVYPHGYPALFCFRIFAQRARCAAAILRRAAADIFRRGRDALALSLATVCKARIAASIRISSFRVRSRVVLNAAMA